MVIWQTVYVQRTSGSTFYHRIGSLSNAQSRGEEKRLYHIRGSEDSFSLIVNWDDQVQTDESNYGKDTFETPNYLYRNDKSCENCCTLGNETGTISALRFCILSGDICFSAETLYQKGLQGLNFHLTLQNVHGNVETVMKKL